MLVRTCRAAIRRQRPDAQNTKIKTGLAPLLFHIFSLGIVSIPKGKTGKIGKNR
jgi:hypothetical protein